MFGILNSLTKAAVAVVATPIAVALDSVDVVLKDDTDFSRTNKAWDAIGDNLNDAIDPDK